MSLYKIMGWTLEQILWLNLIERLLLKLFVEVCLFVEFAKSHRSGANIRLYICSVCAKFQFAKSWFTMKWFAQRIPIENSRAFFNTKLIIYNVHFPLTSQTLFTNFDLIWFSRQIWYTKLLKNGTFQSISILKCWILPFSNWQIFSFSQIWQAETSILATIWIHFGGKIQILLKSVHKKMTFKKISSLKDSQLIPNQFPLQELRRKQRKNPSKDHMYLNPNPK